MIVIMIMIGAMIMVVMIMAVVSPMRRIVPMLVDMIMVMAMGGGRFQRHLRLAAAADRAHGNLPSLRPLLAAAPD